MRLYLQEVELTPGKRLGGAGCESPRERGLAGARQPDKEDDPVQGNDAAVDLATQCEVQYGLREQAVLQILVQDDRLPKGAKGRVREYAAPLNAFGEVVELDRRMLHRE